MPIHFGPFSHVMKLIERGVICLNIYGCHFTYAGVDSNTYSLIIANVDTDRDDRSAGEVTGEYLYRKSDKTFRLLGDSHNSSQMVFDVDIITDDESVLLHANRRAVEKWLFNKQTFRKLYIDEADDPLNESFEMVNGTKKSFYLHCKIINLSLTLLILVAELLL